MTAIEYGDRQLQRWRGDEPLILVTGTGAVTARMGRGALIWRVMGIDAVALVSAALITSVMISGLAVRVAVAVMAAIVGSLGWSGAYDTRAMARNTLPATRCLTAAGRVVIALALVPLVLSAFPATAAAALVVTSALLLFVGRWGVSQWVRNRHAAGQLKTNVLVRGSASEIQRFTEGLQCDLGQPLAVNAVQVTSGAIVPVPGVRAFPPHSDPVETASEAGVDAVVFLGSTGEVAEEMRRSVWGLERRGIDAYAVPVTVPLAAPTVESIGATGLTGLAFRGQVESRIATAAKVVMDMVLSAIALLLLSPVMLGIALAVRLDSPGPVFFRQERVGCNGRRFTMVKYRTMYCDAEERRAELVAMNLHEGGTLFKIPDDPRVTRIGRSLRRYSLDELPQLFNVLCGQMSLVGPRPPLPEEVANYPQDAHRRFRVKPGLTGLWQVSGRSDLDPAESTRLDTHYVENWSPALDVRILARTVHVVFTGSGAY